MLADRWLCQCGLSQVQDARVAAQDEGRVALPWYAQNSRASISHRILRQSQTATAPIHAHRLAHPPSPRHLGSRDNGSQQARPLTRRHLPPTHERSVRRNPPPTGIHAHPRGPTHAARVPGTMSTFIAPPHGNERHIPGKFSALAKDITEGRLTFNAAPERQPQSPFASDPTTRNLSVMWSTADLEECVKRRSRVNVVSTSFGAGARAELEESCQCRCRVCGGGGVVLCRCRGGVCGVRCGVMWCMV